MVSIREHNGRGRAGLVDGHDDVPLRNQMLDLEGVHLPEARGALEKEQDRLPGSIDRRGCERHGVGRDELELSGDERRDVMDVRKR